MPEPTSATPLLQPKKLNDDRPSLLLIEIPMYIGAAIFVLGGFYVIVIMGIAISNDRADTFFVALLIFGMLFFFGAGAGLIFATSQLKRRKTWAWATAVAMGIIYAPSATVLLGAPILFGCFQPKVNDWFNKKGLPAEKAPPQTPSQQPPIIITPISDPRRINSRVIHRRNKSQIGTGLFFLAGILGFCLLVLAVAILPYAIGQRP